MKSREAIVYCRQLLFETRVVNAWACANRVRMAAALERWLAYPDDVTMPRLEAERMRWREEVEHERAAALERTRRDARV